MPEKDWKENERIAENILREKCDCQIQSALSGVKHICFVCEVTKALNAKDAALKEAIDRESLAHQKAERLEAELKERKELLSWVVDNVPSSFWRENKYRGEVLSKIGNIVYGDKVQ